MMMHMRGTIMLATVLLVSVGLLQFFSYRIEAKIGTDEVNFDIQIQIIEREVEKWYQSEFNLLRKIKKAMGFVSDAQRQSEEKHWPRGMMKILQVATGVPAASPIDMAEVRRIVGGLQLDRNTEKTDFKNNLRNYFTKKLSYRDNLSDLMDSYRLHEDLCSPFRRKGDGNFNFTTAIKDLMVLKREKRIDDHPFVAAVIDHKDARSPLYSATWICRYLDEQRSIHIPGDREKIVKDWPYAIE